MVRTKPQTRELVAGPLMGARDASDPTTASPNLARRLLNARLAAGPPGSSQRGRPGCALMGSASGTVVQAGPMTWTLANGTRQTVRVVDGAIQTFNWASPAWTTVVSNANITSASGTLSTTARVKLLPFAERLVISDATNNALWWDGTTGAGGIDIIPKTFTDITVYYSKLCGPSGNSLYWSEPGDALTGYDVGGYSNAWDIPGGYADVVRAVHGTNDGLYVFFERTTIGIIGPSLDSTGGTRANVSPDIGTLSPHAVLETTKGVLFVDADANPWIVRIGLPEPVGLWSDCVAETQDVPRPSLPQAWAVYDEASSEYLIGLSTSGELSPTKWLAFNADTLQYNGLGTLNVEMATAGMVVDDDGVKRWAHSEASGGASVVHGTPRNGPWTDYVAGDTVRIPHEVIWPRLDFDPEREFRLTKGVFGIVAGSRFTVTYRTSRGPGSSGTITVPFSTGRFVLDQSQLDIDRLGGTPSASKVPVGWAGHGRWVEAILRHDEFGEQFGCDVFRAYTEPVPGNPSAP